MLSAVCADLNSRLLGHHPSGGKNCAGGAVPGGRPGTSTGRIPNHQGRTSPSCEEGSLRSIQGKSATPPKSTGKNFLATDRFRSKTSFRASLS